jgi:hypothetical protein
MVLNIRQNIKWKAIGCQLSALSNQDSIMTLKKLTVAMTERTWQSRTFEKTVINQIASLYTI